MKKKLVPFLLMGAAYLVGFFAGFMVCLVYCRAGDLPQGTRCALVVVASSRGDSGADLADPIDKNNFWLNEVRIYNSLREAGFQPENIRVLFPNRNPDFNDTIETLGIQRIKDEQFNGSYDNLATKRNIFRELERFSDLVTGNDTFVMYLGSHGNPSIVEVQASETFLNTIELQNLLVKVRPALGILYSDACHSGAFIKKLGLPRFVLMSTTGEHTYGWGDRAFSGGAYFFRSLVDSESDVNVDGKITIQEAFDRGQKLGLEHMQRLEEYLNTKYNYNQGLGGYDELFAPGGSSVKSSVVQTMIVGRSVSSDLSLYNSL